MDATDDKMKTYQGRVLLVEDDPMQARLIEKWLNEAGYRVSYADTGTVALALAKQGVFDAIITDQELPEADGLQVAEAARKQYADTAILMITAGRDVEVAVGALRGQIDDLLLKPMRREDFLERLHNAIEKRRQTRKSRVILAIGAHPDDVELGCGAVLARHRDEGDRVIILTLTGGARGGEPSERMTESVKAAAVIGAYLVRGDLPDTRLPEGADAIELIQNFVGRFQPDVAYIHTINDNHQDHRAAHLAAMVALREVPTVYCYQSPSTTIDFRPTRFVDVCETFHRKLESLARYESQSHRAYLDAEFVRAQSRYWGRYAGYRLVEPFEVMREAC